MAKNHIGPKILLVDVETAPIIGHMWSIWDQTLGLEQIKQDWHLLSWAAKWIQSDIVMYMDQRNVKNMEDDTKLLAGIWKLLDEADIIITHNGKQFDSKKLNARFIIKGFQPPSRYRHIDTLQIAKKNFAMTSNKLEYLANVLDTKHKKLKHGQFPGFELWKECLKRNKAAWNEMEKYNKHDVLTLEDVYKKLLPWDRSVDFNVYNDSLEVVCACGGKEFRNKGYAYTNLGQYRRYKCLACGAEARGRDNLLSKAKKASLRSKT